MTITVSKQEFCDRVAELLALLERGVEVIVREPDKPELKLTAALPQPVGQELQREWVFNLHPGAWVMSEDFDDPLPDEFWLGESCDTNAKRIPGLNEGQGWMSDDFDEPLPSN